MIRTGIGMPSSHNSAYFISSSYWDRSLVVSPAAEISGGTALGSEAKRSMPMSPAAGLPGPLFHRNGEEEVGIERVSNRSNRNIQRAPSCVTCRHSTHRIPRVFRIPDAQKA